MNNWNNLDFIILLIFAANTVLGLARGATKEIVSTICLSIALIFTIKFTVPLANFFNSSPLVNDVVDSDIVKNFMAAIGAGTLTASTFQEIFYSISLLICFGGAFSICEAMLSFTGFNEVFSFPYAALNRKVGGALGFARGYIFNLILIVILSQHLLKNSDVINNNIVTGSFFANIMQPGARKLDSLISAQKPEAYREILKEKPAYTVEDLYKDLKNVPDANFNQVPNNGQKAPQQPDPLQPNFYQPPGQTN